MIRVSLGAFILMLTSASLVPLGLAGCARQALAVQAEGIDVSHHNGEIEWPRVAGAGISFAYLKATEGETHVDPRFQANWLGAGRAGLQRGAYHFYLLCRPGAVQAANFIRQVEVGEGLLAPAVDLEFAGNCKQLGTRAGTLGEIRAYLAAVETEYRAVPVIYTTPEFHAEWIAGEGFDRHPLWIRSLGTAPSLPHAIWQYDMRGRVPGVSGDVDRNRVAE